MKQIRPESNILYSPTTASDKMESERLSDEHKTKEKMDFPSVKNSISINNIMRKILPDSSSLKNNMSLDDIGFSKKMVPLDDPIEEPYFDGENVPTSTEDHQQKTLLGHSPQSSAASPEDLLGAPSAHSHRRNNSAAKSSSLKKKKNSKSESSRQSSTFLNRASSTKINKGYGSSGNHLRHHSAASFGSQSMGTVERSHRYQKSSESLPSELPVGAVNVPSKTRGGSFSARNELIALASSTNSPSKPEVYCTFPPVHGQTSLDISNHSTHSIEHLPMRSPGSFHDPSISLDISNHSLPPRSPAPFHDPSMLLDISNHSLPPRSPASFHDPSMSLDISNHSNHGRGHHPRSKRHTSYDAYNQMNHTPHTPQRNRLHSYETPRPEDSVRSPYNYHTRSSISSSGDHAPLLQHHSTYDSTIDESLRTSFTGSTSQKKRHHRNKHIRQKSVELYMDDVKGVEQPMSFHDLFFALLFMLNLVGVLYLAVTYGPKAIGDIDHTKNSEIEFKYLNIIKVSSICGVFAVFFSIVLLLSMTAFAKKFIQVALIFSIGLSFSWGTIGIGLRPTSFVPATGIIALALTIGYAFVVWDRIPFASANLCTALEGLTSNFSLVGIAFLYQVLLYVYSLVFLLAVIGFYDSILDKKVVLPGRLDMLVHLIPLISYYWTYQVATHVVHSTVAGTVRTWWFNESASKFHGCSSAPMKSFKRASIYSFGSICKGSLTIGFVQLMRLITIIFCPRRSDSNHSFLSECLKIFQNCTSTSVESLSRKYNPWAFTYVGMYGYKLTDSGEKATELFEKRGWNEITTDELISNVLLMVCLIIGGITGCFGLLLESLDRFHYSSFLKPTFTAFLIGAVVGLSLSTVLFGIISSSVNAVIVCFAGSPVEFENNHPELSQDMRHAWREVWPGCMDITDMTFASVSIHSIDLNLGPV